MLQSRIPQIIAAADAKTIAAVAETVKQVEQNAEARVHVLTGATKGSIRSSASGKKGRVDVGDIAGFFLEFGNSRQAATPFLVPAAEDARDDFNRRMVSVVL